MILYQRLEEINHQLTFNLLASHSQAIKPSISAARHPFIPSVFPGIKIKARCFPADSKRGPLAISAASLKGNRIQRPIWKLLTSWSYGWTRWVKYLAIRALKSVCVCPCACACVCVCVCVCVNVGAFTLRVKYLVVTSLSGMHACMYLYVCVRACMRACVCVCV